MHLFFSEISCTNDLATNGLPGAYAQSLGSWQTTTQASLNDCQVACAFCYGCTYINWYPESGKCDNFPGGLANSGVVVSQIDLEEEAWRYCRM